MPRGKKTTSKKRTTHKRRFAMPIKSAVRKTSAKKTVAKRATQTRTSAKSVVVTKFENLEKELSELKLSVSKMIEVQRAAMLDNYRNFYINTREPASAFSPLVTNSIVALGLTEADLDSSVAELKEDPAPAAPEAVPQAEETANTYHETPSPDLLNVL